MNICYEYQVVSNHTASVPCLSLSKSQGRSQRYLWGDVDFGTIGCDGVTHISQKLIGFDPSKLRYGNFGSFS